MNDSERFERTVAQLLRDAGAEVRHDVNIGGNQIDVIAIFRVVQIPVSVAVECKHYNKRVGIDIVNKFAQLITLLRDAPGQERVDRGLIVSRLGFTRQARSAALTHAIDLTTIDDIISFIAGIPPYQVVGSVGAEAYTLIDAMDGVHLDEKRGRFWRAFNSVFRIRKWSPEADRSDLWEKARECREYASNLDNVHRAAAYMLDAVIHYDEKQFAAAQERLKDAGAVASEYGLRPIFLQSLFWQARCLVEQGLFSEALELVEQCEAASRLDMALATFRAKSQYWRAKIYWLAHERGVLLKPSVEIKELFRDAFHSSDQLGIINYREGARARLAEIAIQEGNVQYGLEELLKSYELTPNLQDRKKLEPIIAKANLSLPANVAEGVGQKVKRELERFRWLAQTSEPQDIQVCDYAVWRFSRFERARVLPYVDGSLGSWITGARDLLEDPELFDFCCTSDDKEGDRAPANQNSENHKYISLRHQLRRVGESVPHDLRHRLKMCRRLFFSSVLINDTGKRGSLSLVPLSDDSKRKILEHRDCDFRMNDGVGFFCHATTHERLSISSELKTKLRHATTSFAEKVFQNIQSRGVFPISVDFLIENQEISLLEFHYPARGFQILYEPFVDLMPGAVLPVNLYAHQIDQFAREMRANSVLLTHNNLFFNDSDRPRSRFYGFEFRRVAETLTREIQSAKVFVCEDWSRTSRKRGLILYDEMAPDIIILDDVDPDHPILGQSPQLFLPNCEMIGMLSDRVTLKRECEQLNIPTASWLTIPAGNEIDWKLLENKLGSLIIAKERFHLPSWHGRKRRCEFVDLGETSDKARLTKWASQSDLIVEEVITTSIDTFGHCGELRVHACVMV